LHGSPHAPAPASTDASSVDGASTAASRSGEASVTAASSFVCGVGALDAEEQPIKQAAKNPA
jgi:hypothetical protein